MSQFKLLEVKSSDGSKDYYIEGYVSTTRPDFVNDIVDELGQKSLFKEVVGKKITMDVDHDEWRDPETGELYDGKKNRYPVAKVVDARLDEIGTWVSAKLNKYHPHFEDKLLPMVKEGYLHSFSIAYNVSKFFTKVLDGIKYRVIQGLKVANVAITGNPINDTATFNITLKSFSKMVEENKLKDLETQNTELKSTVESLKTEVAELKGTDYKKMYEDLKADYDKMKKEMKAHEETSEDEEEDSNKEMKSLSKDFKELKSIVDKLTEENAELKSFVESPQLKSIVEAKSKTPDTNEKPQKVSMFEVL